MATISYKCPNCGGELLFDPATQQYRCDYCVSSFTEAQIEELYREAEEAAEREEQEKEEERQEEQASGVIYICPSCGAEIVTDETTAATFCFYCHNPVVLSGRLSGDYLPDQIIPFQITKEQAQSRFLEGAGKKKFVPKELLRKENLQKISCVYFPYWMTEYEVDGSTRSTGVTVRVWRSGDTEYTETSEYEIEREGTVKLNNYGRNALKTVHTKLVEGVMPFRLEDCMPFRMSYLSGFQAEKRNIEKNQLEEEIDSEMKHYADSLFRRSEEKYSRVRRNEENFRIKKADWSYALFPVWVLTYTVKERIYYFAMNGQTGEVCGELPLDKKKLQKSSLIWSAVTFLILLVGGLIVCL